MVKTQPTINHRKPVVKGWAFKVKNNKKLKGKDGKMLDGLDDVPYYMKVVDGSNGTVELVNDLDTAYIIRDNGDGMLQIILQTFAESQDFELVSVDGSEVK